VLPDDVKRMAPAVLSHRLILRPESRLRKVTSETVVTEILDEIPVPMIASEASRS
jgi:MoxR-like ATPase